MERMPSGPEAPTGRSQPTVRPTVSRADRGRLAVGAGVAAALAGLGVAFAVGAVPSPLTGGSARQSPRPRPWPRSRRRGGPARCSRRAPARWASRSRRCRQLSRSHKRHRSPRRPRRPARPRRAAAHNPTPTMAPSSQRRHAKRRADAAGHGGVPDADGREPARLVRGHPHRPWRPADQREHRLDRLLDAERGRYPALRHRRRQQPDQRERALLQRGADPVRRPPATT